MDTRRKRGFVNRHRFIEFEIAADSGRIELVFEEIAINDHSPYINKKLRETNFSKELSLIVIAIRRSSIAG